MLTDKMEIEKEVKKVRIPFRREQETLRKGVANPGRWTLDSGHQKPVSRTVLAALFRECSINDFFYFLCLH